jgi:hypothetical protein
VTSFGAGQYLTQRSYATSAGVRLVDRIGRNIYRLIKLRQQ